MTYCCPVRPFLKLATRAGDDASADLVEELPFEEPLIVSEHGGVYVRVTVGADEDGRRTLRVDARSENTDRP